MPKRSQLFIATYVDRSWSRRIRLDVDFNSAKDDWSEINGAEVFIITENARRLLLNKKSDIILRFWHVRGFILG